MLLHQSLVINQLYYNVLANRCDEQLILIIIDYLLFDLKSPSSLLEILTVSIG